MIRLAVGVTVSAMLVLVPTAAQAATVKGVTDDAGSRVTIEYRAGSGEANDLSVDFTPGTVFSDAGALITAGRGCSATTGGALCARNPWLIDVVLRDGDDRATIFGYPYAQQVHVSGGPGNDTAVAVSVGPAQVEGDAGDDVLTAESDMIATADGGNGDDIVTANPYLASGYAIGGAGDDQLYFKPAGGRASYVEMDGGSGADLLVAQPAASAGSTLDGGAGDDAISIQGGDPVDGHGFTITGGAGQDTIFGGPVDDTIEAGPGRDVIDVQGGGADTVTCGAGLDVVRYDAGDTIAPDCETFVKP
jgi:Ca2+-binding RTX toxin-like protein